MATFKKGQKVTVETTIDGKVRLEDHTIAEVDEKGHAWLSPKLEGDPLEGPIDAETGLCARHADCYIKMKVRG